MPRFHFRGILEAYSHVWWIRQGTSDGPDSQRCRALCYELTMARELKHAVANAPPEMTTSDALPEVERRLTNLEHLMQTVPCRCRGRDFSDVWPTIREIAKAEDIPWLPRVPYANVLLANYSLVNTSKVRRPVEDACTRLYTLIRWTSPFP